MYALLKPMLIEYEHQGTSLGLTLRANFLTGRLREGGPAVELVGLLVLSCLAEAEAGLLLPAVTMRMVMTEQEAGMAGL